MFLLCISWRPTLLDKSTFQIDMLTLSILVQRWSRWSQRPGCRKFGRSCTVCVSRWSSLWKNQQMPAEEENRTADASACCCLFVQVPRRYWLWPTSHVSAVSGLSKKIQLQQHHWCSWLFCTIKPLYCFFSFCWGPKRKMQHIYRLLWPFADSEGCLLSFCPVSVTSQD